MSPIKRKLIPLIREDTTVGDAVLLLFLASALGMVLGAILGYALLR